MGHVLLMGENPDRALDEAEVLLQDLMNMNTPETNVRNEPRQEITSKG